jgi:hypothetical protein
VRTLPARAAVDGNSKYEITVRSHSPGPIQYSFLVYDSFVGEDGRQAHLDAPVGGLRDRDIKVRSDGSFTITVDSTPPDGRDNHIQTNENARVLLVRNTMNVTGKIRVGKMLFQCDLFHIARPL